MFSAKGKRTFCLGLPVILTSVSDEGKLLSSRSGRLVHLNEVDDIHKVEDWVTPDQLYVEGIVSRTNGLLSDLTRI